MRSHSLRVSEVPAAQVGWHSGQVFRLRDRPEHRDAQVSPPGPERHQQGSEQPVQERIEVQHGPHPQRSERDSAHGVQHAAAEPLQGEDPTGQRQDAVGDPESEVAGDRLDAEQQQRADGDADQEPHEDVDQGIHVSRFSGEVLRPSGR